MTDKLLSFDGFSFASEIIINLKIKKMKFAPCLVFSGKAQVAFDFYSQVFNGQIKDLMRYGDAKDGSGYGMLNMNPEGMKWIMHSSLHFESHVIHIYDEYPNVAISSGNSVIFYVSIAEEKEVKRIFNELSEGGKIIAPLKPSEWCPNSGVVIDRFGISRTIMQFD